MKVVFVILHYLTIGETEKSIEYIRQNIDVSEYHIVVVDNASPNGTGVKLQEKYEKDNNITVLINDKNMGFSRGNNVGFRYARDTLGAEFIVLLNNDVYLIEDSFYKKINKEYQRSKFSVLGPMILTRDGKCNINPEVSPFNNVEDIENKIEEFESEYRRCRCHYDKIYTVYRNVLNIFLKGKKKDNKDFINKKENVKLHGCFLVFSPKYIADFDGLDESTFMYLEEEFLYKHMMSNGHKTVFLPDIRVYHKEDAATDQAVSNARKKKLFFYENNIQSLKELKKVYMFYEDRK